MRRHTTAPSLSRHSRRLSVLSPSLSIDITNRKSLIALGATLFAVAALAVFSAGAIAQGPAYGNDAVAETWSDDQSGYDSSYSYLRTLDGSATLITPENSDRESAQINQPVLPGDRLWVSRGSRAEVVLSDNNILRLDSDTEVVFEQLAGTPETDARTTVLRLNRGNIQLVVVDRALGDELPRIDTPNTTVYVVEAGNFRVTADGNDWTEALVREGVAEVVSRRGSTLVQAGEEAFIEGSTWPEERLSDAGRFDSLERWGDALDERARRARFDDVDDDLRYSASSLDGYGEWTHVDGRRAWRPTRVAVDWRPYHDGRWVSTPAGLAWHSYEPWGWVPYHYGTWDYAPSYGWVWFPGRVFRPAWVYWNFTDHYAAWVPFGYYSRHYGRHHGHRGFRFGVYGWAGGSWDYYRNWIFCPVGYLGYRRQNDYAYYGHHQPERYRRHPVPRGVLTSDTRGLRPDRIRRPQEAVNLLTGGKPDALRDVTGFVARKPALTPDVERQVFADASRNNPNRRVPTVIVDDGGIPVGTLATRPGRAAQQPDRGRQVAARPGRGGSTAADSGATSGSNDPGRAVSNDSWRRPTTQARPARPSQDARPAGAQGSDPDRWRQGSRRPVLNTKPGTTTGSTRDAGRGSSSTSNDPGRRVERPTAGSRPETDAGRRALPPRDSRPSARPTGSSDRPSGRLRSTAPPTTGHRDSGASSSTARRPTTTTPPKADAKPPGSARRGTLRSTTPPRDRSSDAGRTSDARRSTAKGTTGSSRRGTLRPTDRSGDRPQAQRPTTRRPTRSSGSVGSGRSSSSRPRGTLSPRSSGSRSKSDSSASSRRAPTRRPSAAPKSSSRSRSSSATSSRSSSRERPKSSSASSSRSSSSKSSSSSSSRRSTGRRPPGSL